MHCFLWNPFLLVEVFIWCETWRPLKYISTSHQKCSMKKGVFRNFTKFTGKHLFQSLFFFTGLRPVTLFKKRLWHSCLSVDFPKFLRTHFLQNSSGGLFLHHTLIKNVEGYYESSQTSKWNFLRKKVNGWKLHRRFWLGSEYASGMMAYILYIINTWLS